MTCGHCGNDITASISDPVGYGRTWSEMAWGDERDFQCSLSPNGRHEPGEEA